jgi:hypothetical protein
MKCERDQHTFGVQGSVAVRRLANPVTLCDGYGVFFVAASGQVRMAANRRVAPDIPQLGGRPPGGIRVTH